MTSHSSSADDFRIVDLFSPTEPGFTPATSERGATAPSAPGRVGGELPESFLFANPFFAPDRHAPARDRR